MKRCALSLLLTFLSVAVLLLVAGCDNSRDPVWNTNSLPGVIEARIQSDHWYYEFGEPVHIRVMLKNVSRKVQILGNETGPVVDISLMRSGEAHEWAQEHPNDVKRQVTLKPGESYVIEWVVTPTLQATYNVNAWWADSEGDRSGMGVTIFYGIRPPGPMP
jgi:hypothetical protein